MNKISKLILFATGLAVLVGASGCQPHYKVILDRGEQIAEGESVFLDNRVVGNVVKIVQDTDRRLADIAITDRSARKAFRQGIEREGPGSIRLDSSRVLPNAPPLKQGAIIPTRSPLIDLGDGMLASIHGWMGATAAEIRVDAATATASAATAAEAAAAELNSLVRRPGGWIAVGAGSALLLLLVALRGRATSTIIVAALLFVLAGEAAAAPVKRAYVDRNLGQIETWEGRMESDLGEARSAVEAGLPRLANPSAVSAYAYSRLASLLIRQTHGDPGRLSIWTPREIVTQLAARYEAAANRQVLADESLARMQVPFVRLCLLSRDEIDAMLERDGEGAIPVLQDRLDRLSHFPAAAVEARLVTIANIDEVTVEGGEIVLPNGVRLTAAPKSDPAPASEPAAFQQRVTTIERVPAGLEQKAGARENTASAVSADDQLAAQAAHIDPQRAAAPLVESRRPAASAGPTTASVTNAAPSSEVGDLAAERIAPAVPVVNTQHASAPAPNLKKANSDSLAFASIQGASQRSVPGAAPLTAPPPTRTAAPVQVKSDSDSRHRLQHAIVVGSVTIVVIAVILLAVGAGGARSITLARIGTNGAATTIELQLTPRSEQIVLGDGLPRVERADLGRPAPASIFLGRFGHLRIVPGSSRVKVRDKIVDSDSSLEPGDEFEVGATQGGLSDKFVLRSIAAAAGDVLENETAALLKD